MKKYKSQEEYLNSISSTRYRAKMERVLSMLNEGMSPAQVCSSGETTGCPKPCNLPDDCSSTCKNCWEEAYTVLLKQVPLATQKKKVTVEFHLNGKATTALVKEDGKVIQKGIAKQHVDDKYDAGIGMMWALAKAIKVDPMELLDLEELLDEQPTDVLVEALYSKWCM